MNKDNRMTKLMINLSICGKVRSKALDCANNILLGTSTDFDGLSYGMFILIIAIV